MTKIQVLAAEVALKKMVQDGYFSICVIDNVLAMSGGIPDAEDYQVLRTLHCVRFKDMPSELRERLPALIRKVIGSENFLGLEPGTALEMAGVR